MFCMPWFLTLFASKSPLKVTLQLWDRHLERADPPFFIFLAVGLLVHVEKAVLASEASVLPEVLTSLGLSSREDLETVWGLAEGLHSRTPASFASRLRRHALRPPRGGAAARGPPAEPKAAPGAARAGGGQEDPDDHEGAANRLERLERERCFFVLPEEVVGHCYPPSASEARRSWQPSPACPWRMVALT
ncbi:unnamed protein product [Prorocentrum cordatum]|uniref:Rab-GAP TBC domain-containing protein n=1 Tax=Prorocentrum cordatum TaxID=2364126 RepID=A0ABN9V2S6_9DINO|nr:unnamed protein product [Polarella glacialis]